ncbi:MAG: O-antigen ligase family protein [Chitinophagaceae bacterium]
MNFSHIKISNYRFEIREFLILFFAYFLMENIFSWLCLPVSIILLAYEKLLSIVIYGFMLYRFMHLKPSEKIYLGLFTLILIRMVFESMYKFNTPFQQFTLFTVLFPVVYTIFIKYVFRYYDLDILEFVAKFYLFAYILIMLIYGRGFSFSLESVDMDDYGPFSGDSRIVHARSIFTMIIPLLYYMHRYIVTKKWTFLIPFVFCFMVILLHQHRSVWSSALVAMFIYFLSSFNTGKLKATRFSRLAMGSLIVLGISIFFLINLAPSFIDFLVDRFSEIFDPSREDGTGSFRRLQRDTYFPYFLQRPVFGWTFEGFNLVNPLVDWWPEKSGQHFHEGYMEMLYYHGVVGLLLKYSFLIYLVVKAFSKKLSEQAIILVAFAISGLIFSLSYVLPLVFWGHVGMCLFYLERDNTGIKKNLAKLKEKLPSGRMAL